MAEIGLFYNTQNGLYLRTRYCSGDLIFAGHNKRGFCVSHVSIPELDADIKIYSNLGYGKSSYLYARMEVEGTPILCYESKKLELLHPCCSSLLSVVARDDDWMSLFKKICSYINLSKTTRGEENNAAFIQYVKDLRTLLQQENVNVCRCYERSEPAIWEGRFLVVLRVGDILFELLNSIGVLKDIDVACYEECDALCYDYITALKSIKEDINSGNGGNRIVRMADTLASIQNYLLNRNRNVEYLMCCVS